MSQQFRYDERVCSNVNFFLLFELKSLSHTTLYIHYSNNKCYTENKIQNNRVWWLSRLDAWQLRLTVVFVINSKSQSISHTITTTTTFSLSIPLFPICMYNYRDAKLIGKKHPLFHVQALLPIR